MSVTGFGGGIIPGWSAEAAGAASAQRILGVEFVDRVATINLAQDLIAAGSWPVRDQGHRATCTAFAVVAAEELASADVSGGPPQAFSEDYLYKFMRETDPGKVKAEPDDLAATGATFLSQAKTVLETKGLVSATGLSYASDPGLPVKYVVPDDPPGNNIRRPNGQRYVHGIWSEPNLPKGDGFAELKEKTVTGTFLAQLIRGRPIAAGFPILPPPNSDLFDSSNAQSSGDVRYPRPNQVGSVLPIAGHTICIIGYSGGTNGRAVPPGHFLFRNSYGIARFGHDADRDTTPPITPAKGYGTISALDVEDYCWEFLYRE